MHTRRDCTKRAANSTQPNSGNGHSRTKPARRIKTSRQNRKRRPERNPTFRSKEEFLATLESILAYALAIINGIQTDPPISPQDRQDLLGFVSEKLWRCWRRVPRDRGQHAYIRTVVFSGISELFGLNKVRAMLVPAAGVTKADILPRKKARKFSSVPRKKDQRVPKNAVQGPIDAKTLAELWDDPRVLRIIVRFEGFAQPPSWMIEEGEESGDFIESVAIVEPFLVTEAKLDEETIRQSVAPSNRLGEAVSRYRDSEGRSWKETEMLTGGNKRTLHNRLTRFRSRARESYPEFLG